MECKARVIFAIVLKFVDVPLNIISYVNNGIKILSIFVMILFVKKFTNGNLFVASIVSGLIFAGLSYVIFSSLNDGFVFNITIAYDVVFAVLVSVVVCVIVNILKRKSV